VTPIGPMHSQRIFRFVKHRGGLQKEDLGAFCFVLLIGVHAWDESSADDRR
jgi:hypothetical protein